MFIYVKDFIDLIGAKQAKDTEKAVVKIRTLSLTSSQMMQITMHIDL